MTPSIWKFRGIYLVLFAPFLSLVYGQNSGAIQGTAVDQQGVVVRGATVLAVDPQQGIVVRETTTDINRLFNLQPLQPGTYTVHVRARGMRELSRLDLHLDSRQILRLKVTPDSWAAIYYLGKAKFKLNDAKAAVPLLQQAAELNSDEPTIFYALASALRELGRTDEAKQALRRVNELHTSTLDVEKKFLQDANIVGAR